MNIVKYIIEILKENDKVVVPGLGIFSIEYRATTIHPVEHTFTPPEKIIVFESITSDDDLLIRTISEKEHISITDALNAINNFSDTLLSDIQKGKLTGIEGLGVFSLKENEITFIPEATQLSDEQFGLSGFISPAIVRNEFKEKAAINAQKAKDDKIKRSKRNRRYITITVSVIIVTALIFVVFFTDILRNYMYNNDVSSEVKSENKVVENKTQIPVQVQKDTISKENNNTSDVLTSTSSTIKAADTNIAKKENSQGIMYYLVAGSFRSEENANKSVSELKTKGFLNAGIVRQGNSGMWIVYYESHATKEEASKALKQIVQKENRDSWIMKK
jgi:nucleoid DNA-binding protein/cell division septation protein DedD